jgi:hypothetical protein
MTAAVFSPRIRRVLRKGVVYGLAGALTAGDAVVAAARGVTHEAEEVAHAASTEAGEVVREARAVGHREPEKAEPTPKEKKKMEAAEVGA